MVRNSHLISQGVLIVLLFLTNDTRSESIEYLAHGYFALDEGKNLSGGDDDEINSHKGNFSVWVKGCNWLIRWSQSNEPFDYQECGTDGQYVYTIRSVENQAREKRRQGRNVANEFIGNIQDGSIPNPGTSPFANVLWWTLASGCYLNLRTNDNNQFPPIHYNELTQSEWLWLARQTLPAHVYLNKEIPFLPMNVVFMDNGIKKVWADFAPNAASWKQLQETRRLPPYDKGFTNSILNVLEFTNVASLKIPLSADIRVYAPATGGKLSSDLDWRRHYIITITNLQTGKMNAITTVPSVSGKMFTSDARFINDEQTVMKFGYVSADEWMSEANAKKTQAYREALADSLRASAGAGIPAKIQTGKRIMILALLIFLSALVLIFGIRRSTLEAENITNQTKNDRI